jgi:hypothetical protein
MLDTIFIIAAIGTAAALCFFGLAIEALSGNPKKMADCARSVRDFQPPFGAIAKPRNGVADHIRAGPCGLAPSRVVIRQIHGHVA